MPTANSSYRPLLLTWIVISVWNSSFDAPALAGESVSRRASGSQKVAHKVPQKGSQKQTPPKQNWSDQLKGIAPQALKHYYAGRAHLAREHFDKALAEFDLAIKIDPKTPVHEGRARCYAEEGRYKEAAVDLEKAVAQIPTSPRYKFLGEVYAAQKRDALAVSAFSAAIKIDSRDYWCYKNRGDIYLSRKDFKKAIADYTKLIELAPKEPVGYNARAAAYKKWGKPDLADKDYKKVREFIDIF